MELTQQQIQQFKELYKARFQVDLGEADVSELSQMLIQLMKAVYAPIGDEYGK